MVLRGIEQRLERVFEGVFGRAFRTNVQPVELARKLAKEMDDEVLRRFALSYAIAGDRKQSEAILNPLLLRQDKAAWRTRAFSLAILGQVDEAVSIANSTLPPSLAAGTAVVPSPHPRSSTFNPGVTPSAATSASPLSRMVAAMRVKSPFSHKALFGFMKVVPPGRCLV